MFRVLSTCSLLVLCVSILRVNAYAASDDSSKDDKSKSKEEAAKQLKVTIGSIIELMDEDKDEKLTLEELSAWTTTALKEFYKKDSKKRVEKLDTDKDGKVSWEEYLKSEEDIGVTTEEQKKRRFDLADADNDGGLSYDEITSMFHPEERPHMFDVIIKEYMEIGDTNSDGLLTLDEYKEKIVKGDEKDLKAADKFFKQQDKNKDGNLDKEEIKEWITSIGTPSVAKKQAKQVFEKADKDKDGVLNKDEILKNIEMFVALTQAKEKLSAETEKAKNAKDEL